MLIYIINITAWHTFLHIQKQTINRQYGFVASLVYIGDSRSQKFVLQMHCGWGGSWLTVGLSRQRCWKFPYVSSHVPKWTYVIPSKLEQILEAWQHFMDDVRSIRHCQQYFSRREWGFPMPWDCVPSFMVPAVELLLHVWQQIILFL